MELFVFTPSSDPTTLDQGAKINGVKRVTWVERYSIPGEFTIEAPLSAGLASDLPLGSLISHTDTTEVMIVENQEVDETREGDPLLSITGRSFTSYLENRIVGMNLARASTTFAPYSIAANYTWLQLVTMINDCIQSGVANVNDAIANVVANHSMTGAGIESLARTIEYGDCLTRVQELLKIDDLGIRTIRRNPFGVTGGSATETRFNIYKGVDKTASVMLSWVTGDLNEAKYLFSQKNDKNCALVVGTYLSVVVDGAETKYGRRVMIVDGKDIDSHFGALPTGADLTASTAAMTTRGKTALANQNKTTITQIDLSDNSSYMYRRDYNLGDLVSIDGNFGQMDVRRVTEYAEIEDETGRSGHPTLAVPGE